jgi:Asp-tRNA(Asn)/Glu-tRNA(Gln) amidotransferase A subunit family amidase
MLTRSDFLRAMVGSAAVAALPAGLRAEKMPLDAVTVGDLKSFAKIAGLTFSETEYAEIIKSIKEQQDGYQSLRKQNLQNSQVPVEAYRVSGSDGFKNQTIKVTPARVKLKRPKSDEDIAFLTVVELSHLIQTRQISSLELTTLYLKRLKEFGPKLLCVVTLCEETALAEAKQADQELLAGKSRGPLHGIPYGIKDLFAKKGYPTQWGTAAYKGQVIEEDAAVVTKLREAGAILVAKLSLGALAMNDVWFGGKTLNPWNPKEGSSGSSAGSASAMAAGLVAFTIGTETSGSIVSPSQRCRVTGFRPTFGSVSRYGAMCLAYSMDKVGPICRTAEDAALVFAALLGQDSRDVGSIARPFIYSSPKNLKGMRVGILGSPPAEALDILKAAGAELSPFKAPETMDGLDLVIAVEASAMFDSLTRSERLALVTENGWPEFFQAGRFIPAVEYVQAQRARTILIERWKKAFAEFDVVISSGIAAPMIYDGNLTGYPQLFVPLRPTTTGYSSVSLLAKPWDEAKQISAAHVLQAKTQFHRLRPDLSRF